MKNNFEIQLLIWLNLIKNPVFNIICYLQRI